MHEQQQTSQNKSLFQEKNKKNSLNLYIIIMNSRKGKCIVLAVIMVLLLQNSSASIYNASCFNKANYLPGGSVSSYTCDFWYNAMSGSGQMLASINWATVTPAFIAAMADVNGQSMISMFDHWSTGCCVRIQLEYCCVFLD